LTNGFAAHRQQPDPGSANRRIGLHETHPLSAAVATLPFGSVLADASKEKNAKVTLVYQHELPNVPGKSIKSVLVEYGPRGYSPGHTHPKCAFIYVTVLEGAIRCQVNDGPVTIYKAGQSFSERPGDRHGVRRQCQQDAAGQAPRGVRHGHERDGPDDPIRELLRPTPY
jgi:quercetin dioxygenase-like cupin family protein